MTKKLRMFVLALIAPALLLSACAEDIDSTETASLAEGDVAETNQALGGFLGCRGNGLAVCDELVDPIYFSRHPQCTPNLYCAGQYAECDSACPPRAADEIPNANIRASGAYSTNMMLDIGYPWSSGPTGGFHHAWVSPGSPTTKMGRGVGVSVPNNWSVTATCYNYDSTRVATSIDVKWWNGQTQSFPCQYNRCSTGAIPLNGGLSAVCRIARL